MDIVITMAGQGSRFSKAGYLEPKYMIKVKGRTLFEWSMKSIKSLIANDDQLIFITRNTKGTRDFITDECSKMGLKNIKIECIDFLTDGQATTAMLAAKYWNPDSELLIYNIDTYVEEGELKRDIFNNDGVIPCFNAPGNHWSFVSLDENGYAIEVREKERISNNCSIGAYYFKSCKLYETLYGKYYMHNSIKDNDEKYIAPIYNLLIKMGGSVRVSMLDKEKVHVLGTPDEVSEFEKLYTNKISTN